MKPTRRSAKSGFTLLENVLALGIFIFSITAIIEILMVNALLVDEIRDNQVVEADVDNILQERLLTSRLVPGKTQLDQQQGISFTEEVKRLDFENSEGVTLDGLFEITISAHPESGSRKNEAIATASAWVNINQR